MGNNMVVLGDFHDQKAVYSFEENGKKIIYKPRNAHTELAFKAFLLALKEKGFIYLPGYVNIIKSSNDYHLVEPVKHLSLSDKKEAELYYKRCGALLFFAYIFSASDLHSENIIACGEYPVLVDYETLLSGSIKRKSEFYSRSLISTVISTHLLPNWERIEDKDIDNGGFSGRNKNIPELDGKPVFIYDYDNEFIEGFRYAYNFTLENNAYVKELIHLFSECSFRVLLRPSKLYVMLYEWSKRFSQDEKKLHIKELLAIAYKKDIDPREIDFATGVLDEETEAVLRGEAPLFLSKGNDINLYTREKCIREGFFSLSPVDHSINNLNNLSERDCNDQIAIISQIIDSIRPLSKKISIYYEGKDILQYIISCLEKKAIHRLEAKWVKLTRDNKGTLCFENAGLGLYDGLLGILVCYAAIYYKTGRKDVLDLLLKHYEMFHGVGIPSKVYLNDRSASLQIGIGGYIKALAHIYDLTHISMFVEDIDRLADSIVISDNNDFCEPEILGGYAGIALALPFIKKSKGVYLAKQLGNALEHYTPSLTGVAHGAAGITIALGEIGNSLQTTRYDEKIIELLRWENEQYDELNENWYDMRTTEKNSAMAGWCSGAPGIFMARKKLYDISANSEIRTICMQDLEKADAINWPKFHKKRDHLCCGNASILMACSYLGLKNDNLRIEVALKAKEDSLSLVHVANTCDFTPGLMQGLAGVGYALAMYGKDNCGEMLI